MQDKKVLYGAGVAAFAAVAAVSAYIFSPSQEDVLSEWNSEWRYLCTTDHNETYNDLGLSPSGDARQSFDAVKGLLKYSGVAGEKIEASHGEDMFCFGNKYIQGQDIAKRNFFWSGDIYFVDFGMEDKEVELAHYLHRFGYQDVVSSQVNAREDDFTLDSGLIWNRVHEALKALVFVEAAHVMLMEDNAETPSRNVFEHVIWQRLKSDERLTDVVHAYEGAAIEGRDNKGLRLHVFEEALYSAQLQNGPDMDYLRWYGDQVDIDSGSKSVSCDTSSYSLSSNQKFSSVSSCDTQDNTKTVYYDEYPESHVASDTLDPRTIVELTGRFFAENFIDQSEARDIVDFRKTTQLHSPRARSLYDIARRDMRDNTDYKWASENYGVGLQ